MDTGFLGWLAGLPPTPRVCTAFCELVPTLVMGYLFLAPLHGAHSKALGTLVGHWRKRIREVGGTDKAGQDATNGCVGSSKRTCFLYQIPGASEALGWTTTFPRRT